MLDVVGEVGLGPRRSDQRHNELPGRHPEVTDQGQRPVSLVLELNRAGFPAIISLVGAIRSSAWMPVISSTHTVWVSWVRSQRRRREVCVADRLDLLLKPGRVPLGGVEPIPALVGLHGGLAEVAGPHSWEVEIDTTMRRLTAWSASSWAVQWVMGRPDFSGELAGDREDHCDLLRGELPGGAGAWAVGEDRLDSPAQVGFGLAALEVQSGRTRPWPSDVAISPTWRPPRPSSSVMSSLRRPSKAKRMMAAAVARRCEGAVTALRSVEEDVVLSFGDDNLGRLVLPGMARALRLSVNLVKPGKSSVTVNFMGSQL